MSGGHLGIQKETFTGIFGGLVIIAIFVSIGSFIAQSMSHGGGHGGGHEAPAAAEQPAAAH